MFAPVFHITPTIAKALMAIEADRQAVEGLPLDVEMLASLRETARLAATHYSTQIEGNRLTEAQVKEAVKGAHFPGRERDQREVRCYYKALEETERLAGRRGPLREGDIQRLQGLVLSGLSKAKPYRDGQNVIRDSRTGGIVYMPPEAKDVPGLMKELVAWINRGLSSAELPAPLIAGLAHVQYATIHPYYDGNGRTARLLATLILHCAGYGLKGIFSLDEYYARHLAGYYKAIAVGPSHNYYLGRAEADLTPFLTYFCRGMAEAFGAVRAKANAASGRGAKNVSDELRKLDPRERRLLELFRGERTATSAEIAAHLGLSPRTVVGLCRSWLAEGALMLHDASRKNRRYQLGEAREALIRK